MGNVAMESPAEGKRDRQSAKSAQPAQLRARMRMGEKGRIVIPAVMREAIGIGAGDAVDWRVEDGELRLSTIQSRIRRAQQRASQYVKPGTLVSDELSAERREAAKHE